MSVVRGRVFDSDLNVEDIPVKFLGSVKADLVALLCRVMNVNSSADETEKEGDKDGKIVFVGEF